MIAGNRPLIIYNGGSGGLGRQMADSLLTADLRGSVLHSRLESPSDLAAELAGLGDVGDAVLIQLAARVSVPACEADPEAAREINVVFASQALDVTLAWARDRGTNLRVIYVSTGHVYGVGSSNSLLPEDAPTGPRSVYASTKLAAEHEFAIRTEAARVPLTIARVFGLLAPNQPAQYVLPGLIARVRQKRLRDIPGLDMTRDYLDARDVCRDLVALASAPRRDGSVVVNVCSGEATTIRTLLEIVLQACGEDPVRAATIAAGTDRPDDVPWIVGDPGRFVEWTGLQPRSISIVESVRDAVAVMGI